MTSRPDFPGLSGLNPFAGMSAIPFENLYHLALVVPRLDDAMVELADQLGCTWAPRREFPIRMPEPGGGVSDLTVAATYSRQGPPFLELIEQVGRGIWGPGQGAGVHHVGLYAGDVDLEIARLERSGFRVEARGVQHDGAPGGPVYLRNGYGLRVEVAGAAAREMIASWVRA
jgi:hypothetical protein